jgi:hypothetical protein
MAIQVSQNHAGTEVENCEDQGSSLLDVSNARPDLPEWQNRDGRAWRPTKIAAKLADPA